MFIWPVTELSREKTRRRLPQNDADGAGEALGSERLLSSKMTFGMRTSVQPIRIEFGAYLLDSGSRDG